MPLSMLTRLVPACAAALVFTTGCTIDPEKQAQIDAMVAEQKSEEEDALARIVAAREHADLAHYTDILPLMQRPDLLVDFDGTIMNVDSATRKVLRENPAVFREALTTKVRELIPALPMDDTPLPMDQAQELLVYVKLMVDTASEIRLSGGASTVPSVNVFVKAEGENGPTQLTVGYLYPYGTVTPASQVVLNGSTLPELVDDLDSKIASGLATTAADGK